MGSLLKGGLAQIQGNTKIVFLLKKLTTMKQGRYICNTLKAIRKEIAKANDIKYEPRECTHEGDCAGTCPACEAEVRYLEGELGKRRRMGRKVAVAGIAVGMVGLTSSCIGRIFQPTAGETADPRLGEPVDSQMLTVDTVRHAAEIPDESELMGEVPMTIVDTIRPVKADEDVLDGIVEEHPVYPGGDKAMLEYLKANLQMPDECVQGRVVVSFLIDSLGNISEARVTKSLSEACDREALRLVNAMPRWEPGKQLGRPVNTRYTIPITFRAE